MKSRRYFVFFICLNVEFNLVVNWVTDGFSLVEPRLHAIHYNMLQTTSNVFHRQLRTNSETEALEKLKKKNQMKTMKNKKQPE